MNRRHISQHNDISDVESTWAVFGDAEASARRPRVDRPVVDKTGVGDAVRFQWFQCFSPNSWGKENGVKPVPELLTALEDQLGLTLKPAEEAVESLVIDRAVQAT